MFPYYFTPFLCASSSPIITKPRCIHKYKHCLLMSLLTRGEYSNWREPCSPVLCMDAWLQCCILPVSNVLCHLLPLPSKAISSTKDTTFLHIWRGPVLLGCPLIIKNPNYFFYNVCTHFHSFFFLIPGGGKTPTLWSWAIRQSANLFFCMLFSSIRFSWLFVIHSRKLLDFH